MAVAAVYDRLNVRLKGLVPALHDRSNNMDPGSLSYESNNRDLGHDLCP